MSYYTRFEVHWDGGRHFDPTYKEARKLVLSRMEEYLGNPEAGEGWLAWIKEFRDAFEGRPAAIKGLEETWADGLMSWMSAHLPEVLFGMRGVGEELDDVWVHWYQGGRRLAGPPASSEGEKIDD